MNPVFEKSIERELDLVRLCMVGKNIQINQTNHGMRRSISAQLLVKLNLPTYILIEKKWFNLQTEKERRAPFPQLDRNANELYVRK